MSKIILIAAATLVGGIAKNGELKPFELAAGDELTADIAAKLGLSKDDVAQLIERGTVVEAPVRDTAADTPADIAELEAELAEAEADLAAATERAIAAEAKLADETKRADDAEAAFAAETKRADDAEAKVKDLEKQLADAAKAAKPAAGAQA